MKTLVLDLDTVSKNRINELIRLNGNKSEKSLTFACCLFCFRKPFFSRFTSFLSLPASIKNKPSGKYPPRVALIRGIFRIQSNVKDGASLPKFLTVLSY